MQNRQCALTSSVEVLQIFIIFLFSWFSICLLQCCIPSYKKVFRALLFLTKVLSIIILRLISIALLWCQFRCSILTGTSILFRIGVILTLISNIQ